MKDTFILNLTYKMSVDTETGEILETKLISRNTNKKEAKGIVDDENPKLYLEENKCRINNSALNLLGVNIGDKIEIEYYEQGNKTIPVITPNKGNKITKSLTIAFRGVKHDVLSKYGNEFIITKNNGMFMLGDGITQEVSKDENLEVPDDLNLDDLIDSEDNNIQSIDSNFFKL